MAVLYVVDRGWHTEIGLATDEIAGPLAAIADTLPGARYLTFGFGDHHYLMRRETDFLDMLRATLPGEGAMLVTGLRTPLLQAFGDGAVIPLRLSRTGLQGVSNFLWDSFDKDRNGTPIRLADGPYPGSVFYAAAAGYDGLHTCNTWVAEGLQAGGLPIVSVGVVLAGQLTNQARALSRRQEFEKSSVLAGSN
jgi:hypothetical protein